MNNILYIIRGISGSGKSTFAKSLGCPYFEADMYFIDPITGEYKWDGSKIKQAHEWCFDRVHESIFLNQNKIAVSNTFTEEWEMEKYINLAKKYDYTVISFDCGEQT